MNLFRPEVQRLHGYVPGEQPQDAGWIKLNTNENPYPPAPKVIAAIQQAAEGRLNVYPDPLATRFRKVAAELFDVEPDMILPANGSDENLTILLRTFISPGELVAYPYPSYILYETLAEIQGGKFERVWLNTDWSWNDTRTQSVVKRSKLFFVPNPNSPSGNVWSDDELLKLQPEKGVLVIDEAYADFSEPHSRLHLLQQDGGNQRVITRTLSKSCSLAGIRFGFAIAQPELIAGMRKVKDSYNCNTLSLAAATAALEEQEWMRKNVRKIISTRNRLVTGMRSAGFNVVDSETNFVWATRDDGCSEIFEELKLRKILVRYMRFDGTMADETIEGLRITVGTDDEIDGFLSAMTEILGS